MGNLKIKFLGTGDALNTGGRANQAILFQSNGKNLLVDCGPTTLYLLQQYNPALIFEINAALFTHFHGDHFIGIVALDLAMDRLGRTKPILYAGPENVEDQFYKAYNLCYPGLKRNVHFVREFQKHSPYQTKDILQDGHFQITPIPMVHGSMVCLGYRIQIHDYKIAISGDTVWNDQLPALCNGTDIAILECKCYYAQSVKDHHLSYEQIEQNLPQLNTKRLILVHPGQEALEHLASKDVLAKDGLELQL